MIESQKLAFRETVRKFMKWTNNDVEEAIEKYITENHGLIDDGEALLLIAEKWKIGMSAAFKALLEETHKTIDSVQFTTPAQEASKFIEPAESAENWNEFWVRKEKSEFIPWEKIDGTNSKVEFKLIDAIPESHMKMVSGTFGNSACLNCLDKDGKPGIINVKAWYLRDALMTLWDEFGRFPDKVIHVDRKASVSENKIVFECQAKYL